MASKLDAIIEKIAPGKNLKYEDLNYLEREEVDRQLAILEKRPLSIEDIRKWMDNQIANVEKELVEEDEFVYFFGFFKRVNRKHLFLKSHLKCYLLIRSFLQSKEKAKSMLEMYQQKSKPLI